MKKTVPKEVKDEILAKVKSGESASSLSVQYVVSTKSVYTWHEKGIARRVGWLEHVKLKRSPVSFKQMFLNLPV